MHTCYICTYCPALYDISVAFSLWVFFYFVACPVLTPCHPSTHAVRLFTQGYGVLYHHGDIYMDSDFIVLKDLSPVVERLDHDLVSYCVRSNPGNTCANTFSSNFLAGRKGSHVLKEMWEKQKACGSVLQDGECPAMPNMRQNNMKWYKYIQVAHIYWESSSKPLRIAMFIGVHGVGMLQYSCSQGAVGFWKRCTVFCNVLLRFC